MGYQKNSTDGYLRKGETDINTLFTRLGFILPMEGQVSLSGSFTTADRETPVNNDPESDDYDSDYPKTESSAFDSWQYPTWDKEAWAYRLNYQQDLPIGRLNIGAYTSKEDRDRASWNWVNTKDHSQGIKYTPWVTTWHQKGGKIMDEYKWTDNHSQYLGLTGSSSMTATTATGTSGRTKRERLSCTSGAFCHPLT